MIRGMLPLLKAARRPLRPEHEHVGLDGDGEEHLDRIVDELIRHLYFEHLSRKQIEETLYQSARSYREAEGGKRPPIKQQAAETIDALASEPLQRTVYLGVTNLKLPHGTVVGDVTFVDPSLDPELVAAFANGFTRTVPELLCEVVVTAGTSGLLLSRARYAGEIALGLVRQHNLFGFMAKIYLEQVLYGFDGTWVWRDGETTGPAGWWREHLSPFSMELDHPNGEDWRVRLSQLSELYSSVPLALRQRVDTCIEWLDVAASSNRWRIIIPAIFSGMEALLVPETTGLKAEVVTVRSVAVHVALERGFSHPGKIMMAYKVRGDLVHGSPTQDYFEEEALDFAESRRHWAFEVLRDYLELVKVIGATKVDEIVLHLDRGACNDVCRWLDDRGGSKVVKEYRRVVPAQSAPIEDTSIGNQYDTEPGREN